MQLSSLFFRLKLLIVNKIKHFQERVNYQIQGFCLPESQGRMVSRKTPKAEETKMTTFERLTYVDAEAYLISLAACEHAQESKDAETRHKAIDLAHNIRLMEEGELHDNKPTSPILHNLRQLAALKGTDNGGMHLATIALCKEFGRLATVQLQDCSVCKAAFESGDTFQMPCCDKFVCNDCRCDCPRPSPERLEAEFVLG
jgi:hypothetical protein